MTSIIGYSLLFRALQPDGTCSQIEKVNFRGIHFQFPMKVRGVMKVPGRKYTIHSNALQTDSLGGKNISGSWFFERGARWNGEQKIDEEVRNTFLYGVALTLFEDRCRTDQELIAELQLQYPGDYKYKENWGMKYFVCEHDCLTIFVKRFVDSTGASIPEVSFCYGLSFPQADMYGIYTGYINNYPD